MNIPKMTGADIDTACLNIALADYDKQTEYDRAIAHTIIAARDAQWQAALAEQEPVAGSAAWDNSEGWESLAWELCADENGEESCNELIWEGGPVPEPWGERWLKYEDEAKRLIKLVHKHVPAPSTPAAQERAEPVAPTVGKVYAYRYSRNGGKTWFVMETDPTDIMPDEGGIVIPLVALLSATPPAPAQPLATSDPEGHRQAIADHEAATQPSPEPSKPEAPDLDSNLPDSIWLNDMGTQQSLSFAPRAGAHEHHEYRRATLPPASAAGEREDLSQWEKARFGYFDQAGRFVEFSGEDNELPNDSSPRWVGGLHDMQLLRAALATKPQAEQEAAELPPLYMLAKLQMVMPLFQEARDALPAITEAQRKLHGISSSLDVRMDEAGTFSLADWNEARTRGDEVGKSS